MQAAEYTIQWYIWKYLAGIQQDIDDARMRARTEDDEPLPLHVDRHVTFVQDQGIRLPGLIHGLSAEMIRAALFKARYPGNLPAHVEAIFEEKPRGTAVDHLRAVRCEFLGCGHFLKRRNLTAGQLRATLQEHPRVHVARHLAAAVVPGYMVERVEQRAHMVPVA